MPRTIELNIPPEKADSVLRRVQDIEGVVSLACYREAGIEPPGDVLTIQSTNDAMREVLGVLDELEVTSGGSITTSEPRSIISPEHQGLIDWETNETIWDEMVFLLREDTNLSANYLALMTLAGAVAAVGLWANTLHLVVGAMVIAPGFEPLVQVPFGFIVGPKRTAWSGALSSAAGYFVLAIGGLASLLILGVVDPSRSADLQSRSWVQFWSTVTPTGVVASAFAGVAGAFVVSGQRSVLTTGVMIALALIPSMAIVGMAVGAGDFVLAGRALVRWLVDVGLVILMSALVLMLKRWYLRSHRALS